MYSLDIDGLKDFISSQAGRNLTGGEDARYQEAIEWGKLLITAKFKSADVAIDWTEQIIILAGLHYAVYRLYQRIENETIPKDKLDMGNELLRSFIGNYAYNMPIDGGGGSGCITDKLQSVFYVEAGTDSYNGYGGFS
jgi:hypothetical protein